MDAKKALAATGRGVGFVAFGGAWWSMKMSASLLRREFGRTRDNAQILRDMAKEAKEQFKNTRTQETPDAESFEAAANQAAAMGVLVGDVYRHFLTRKRVALFMAGVFLCIGVAGVTMGAVLGILPMLIGTAFCLEMAWLAEFRLWQVRNRRLAREENASVRDFARDPGAWRGALRIELGAGIDSGMRQYRGWLVAKRLALAISATSLALAAVRHVAPEPFLLPAGVAFLIALVVELRLSRLRPALGLRHPRFAPLRFERGVGYKRTTA